MGDVAWMRNSVAIANSISTILYPLLLNSLNNQEVVPPLSTNPLDIH